MLPWLVTKTVMTSALWNRDPLLWLGCLNMWTVSARRWLLLLHTQQELVCRWAVSRTVGRMNHDPQGRHGLPLTIHKTSWTWDITLVYLRGSILIIKQEPFSLPSTCSFKNGTKYWQQQWNWKSNIWRMRAKHNVMVEWTFQILYEVATEKSLTATSRAGR